MKKLNLVWNQIRGRVDPRRDKFVTTSVWMDIQSNIPDEVNLLIRNSIRDQLWRGLIRWRGLINHGKFME